MQPLEVETAEINLPFTVYYRGPITVPFSTLIGLLVLLLLCNTSLDVVHTGLVL